MACMFCEAQLSHTHCFNADAPERALEDGLAKAAKAAATYERARIVEKLRKAAVADARDRDALLRAIELILRP